MKKSLLGFLVFSVMACGKNPAPGVTPYISNQSHDPKIFGGKAVSQNPLQKSMVAIYSQSEGGFLCSGTLISEKIILTAAHCIGKDISKMQIIFGKDLRSSHKIKRPVQAAFPHPEYNPKAKKDQKDIGLVILAGDLPEGYEAAEILNDSSLLKDGLSTKVLGFGISWPLPGREAEKKGAGVLREVELEIDNATFSETEISLKQGPFRGGMCNGDSGGPAAITIDGQNYLWGVGSRARGAFFASCIVDSVYTRVDMYGAWIEQVIADYQSK